MKTTFQSILVGILTIVILFGLTWGGISWYRFFEPKREQARREVFEQTRSYNQAKLQELAKYRLEYMRSDNETERAAIQSTVNLRFADLDHTGLPQDLQDFLQEMNQ